MSELITAAQVAATIGANIPAPLIDNMWKAVNRLVGAYVDKHVRPIEDETASRSQVRREIAAAAAKMAIADEGIVRRAMEKLVDKEILKQKNKEEILRKAAEDLRNSKDEPSGKIDDDWLNIFERLAEDASSERLQLIWSKVLSGEIRKPGSFSPRTMRFISELDHQTAADFNQIAPFVLDDEIYRPAAWHRGEKYSLAIRLTDAGLLTGASGHHKYLVYMPPLNGHLFSVLGGTVVIHAPQGRELAVPVLGLTRTAQELMKILPPPDVEKSLRSISAREIWEPQGAHQVDLILNGKPIEILWKAATLDL